MSLLSRLAARLVADRPPLFHDEAYRLPIPTLEAQAGIELRRSELAASWLSDVGVLQSSQLRAPPRASMDELALVHSEAWLEALGRPEVLGRVFGVPESEVPVDATMHAVRLATGGTIAAGRAALARGGPAFNLLGGFHHAGPEGGGGLCPINDVAIAIAVLRREGFHGRVVILDLDAHPPDGTAKCVAGDRDVWLGSISGVSWGDLPGVDETVLPIGASDDVYLGALHGLLARMPTPALAFVLAGGDVLAGDKMGRLGLTLAGARQRDLAVDAALRGRPSVWLPAGGYSQEAWRVLAGSYLAVTRRSRRPIPRRADPLSRGFRRIYESLKPEDLFGRVSLDFTDLEELFGGKRGERLLGAYTAAGIEYGLWRYGIDSAIRRLGYRDLRVELDRVGEGDRARLFGEADGARHVLFEVVLKRAHVAGRDVLFVNWLSLRHPRARFTDGRPRLPGQEVPGLGLAREASELLERVAERLGLAGVAVRPAHFHVAYGGRQRFRFAEPAVQGRFEALVRDLAALPLPEATRAVDEGRVRLNGAPWRWEPAEYVAWLKAPLPDPLVAETREASRFTVEPPP